MSAALAVPDSDREYHCPDRDFARVCNLIHARAGISLDESKRNMVYSRLARRPREHELSSFAAWGRAACARCGSRRRMA